MARLTKLSDCNPVFRTWNGKSDEAFDAVCFDCPEGHEGCRYEIPFTPALDGTPGNQTRWSRTGNTFETLTLSPSIKGVPKYSSKEECLASLAPNIPIDVVHPRMWCSFHGFIKNGLIEFCGDSK